MPLLVMKFGGTSVADLSRIENAAKKVQQEVERGYDVIVIVSAMSGKTNEMVGWVESTSKLYDAREYDAVVSSGENVTAGLMALRLQEMGVPARSWQGWQVPINTTSVHGSARFIDIPRANIDAKFAEGFKVAVVAGFQGLSAEGRNLFAETQSSGTPNISTPGLNGAGFIRQGYLERSNVDPVTELVSLILAQRAYEFNTRAIRTSDNMLQATSELIR